MKTLIWTVVVYAGIALSVAGLYCVRSEKPNQTAIRDALIYGTLWPFIGVAWAIGMLVSWKPESRE